MPNLPLAREFKLNLKEIPGDEGFWKASTELTYLEAAAKLLQLGLDEEETLEFLTNLYSATSEEFGG